ncbi:relaxin-3 [Bombina bombina]|uniref:relaxin-3 n=1 Tax=Bombina bombina TaxID=8345 RepID=UPI00235AA513|nr:relaxin-3 [Bombina bombina]
MQLASPAILTALWLLAWHSGTQATSRVPSFGVKLCGREFIRAVIFTCGGSRWRRNEAIQTEDPAELIGSLVPTDVDSEEMLSEWASSLRIHNSELMDYGASQGWRDLSGIRRGVGAAAEDPLRGVERRGREAALGLSNTCCKWGCSKSQISSLC